MIDLDGSGSGARPWDPEVLAGGVCLCTLVTSGDDPGLDQVLGIHALSLRDPGGDPGGDFSSELFEQATEASGEEGAAPLEAVWSTFAALVRGRPVIVARVELFDRWWRSLAEPGSRPPVAIGLEDMRGLLAPGRATVHAGGALPQELQAELEAVVRDFLGSDPRSRRVAAEGYTRAWRGLRAVDARAAERLALALSLVEHPSTWSAVLGARMDGGLSLAVLNADAGDSLLDELSPRCADEFALWAEHPNVPPQDDNAKPFLPEDRATLDALFEKYLPAIFEAERRGADAGASCYRASQHAVARETSRTLGADELLLVHAPTGTGKTMAYLVPALLWARRHEVRVGVATYTRALQEQAMEREVPRVLEAMRSAGLAPGWRVSVLKGRENYLCWRALRLLAPGDDDDAETWLAWTALVLFALTDETGDLDRLGSRPPLTLDASAPFRRTLGGLVRSVRAQTGCCMTKEDRFTCAAELARRRAERSHVVITNHAFALSRQDFFKHVVFDECEHLHDQAHNAWSHHLPVRSLTGLLSRLHRTDRRASRAPLDRVAAQLLANTPSHATLTHCLQAWDRTRTALSDLRSELAAFERWRRDRRRGRGERDDHSLLRDYVSAAEGVTLLGARRELVAAGGVLDSGLAEVAETLDRLPLRGAARIRRGLDVGRTDLSEALAALVAWIPMSEGQLAFRRETFYDVEFDARGEPILSARVLLPNEFLGRYYYPALANAVFLSATTRLQGDFAAAAGYLGLDRSAEPAEDEERVGRVVRHFHAPEVFDYSRVLVGVPRDAPNARDKGPFLDYVRKFLGYLVERTRGRTLVLFTNLEDVRAVGTGLAARLRELRIPLWFQGMDGVGKEELSELFRTRVESMLLGVDTFWYGADFPGETLQYLVIVRLPYGVPDRYHHAQGAALGENDQRRRIYMPRALAKLRQGFGRLMRREDDRGCVFLLDGRVLEPRHRSFLRELPVQGVGRTAAPGETLAHFVRGDTDHVVRKALEHMGKWDEMQDRGLLMPFRPQDTHAPSAPGPSAPTAREHPA